MSRALVSLLLAFEATSFCGWYAASGFSLTATTTPRIKHDETTTILKMQQQPHSPHQQQQQQLRRRQLISLGLGVLTAPLFLPQRHADAAVVDERNTFANTAFDSSYRNEETPTTTSSSIAPTDEITIEINLSDLNTNDGGGLGIELGQIEFRTNTRVVVKSVRPNSLASKVGIQPNWVVVGVNGQSAERTDAKGVSIMVARASKNNDASSLVLTFRDVSKFNKDLQNLSPDQTVTTQVAPAGDTTQRRTDGSVKLGYSETTQEDQQLSVTQLIPPKLCNRGAQTDDLLEISYIGILADTGQVFDGSAITVDGKAIPGRGNDVSLFFVLKKQPFGQFPPGWDVGLEGMCVGERRRVIIPPALAYGDKGVPRRGIPPNATLQYDITLISINGLAMPQ